MTEPGISRVFDSRITLAEFREAVGNLFIALAVAHIGDSIDVLARCFCEGRKTGDEVVAALALELAGDASRREKFTGQFEASFKNEILHRLGHRAGLIVFEKLIGSMRGRDLAAMRDSLLATCHTLHRPLVDYLAAQEEVSRHSERLIRAIADQGIESIDAFKMIENLRVARTRAEAALARLVSVNPEEP